MDLFTVPYALLAVFFVACYFLIFPFIQYLRDPKGLRRFHNLNPFAGISNLPFIILAHTGARTSRLVELHKTHPVIRLGPNALSFGDVKAIKDIYGHGTKCTKDGQYLVTSGSHYHLADVIDKPDHSRKRKVLSAAYALKNLEQWEGKVADKVMRVNRHFDKCCTSPLSSANTLPAKEDVNVDFREWTNYFALDAITDIGLSQSLGFLDAGNDLIRVRRPDGSEYECHFRPALYDNARKQSLLVWSYDWYKTLDKLSNVFPFYRELGKRADEWNGIPDELAARRLERYRKGEKLDDFFQALMEDKAGTPNNLEWGEIVAEISIMANAGSATTAIAVTNVMYQLIKHPEIMAKLREELDHSLGDDDTDASGVVSYDSVKHLPYLRACLDESLRLFPPTPQNLPRETPPEGAYVDGQFIPGGTSVSISALCAHRDETIYPQADKFIPERFLGEAGKELQPYFITFSAGARGCIGRNISYLEQTVLIASLVRRYEFALPSPNWELQRLETMNWLIKDMPVKIWRRQKAAEEVL
ncbi:cytochrome P450 monooxygenase [Myriangium duriaei CBS 260.36]|uniref:Cytochrome P450 monooxygenase n=1 Tax=Myriangium duriaei CBS 260.36 TaxID=1168546 RepID=A0A9P4J927_9PEZI|nr:cytochrome P450 monooxygenase [Myriangium duriaei CBS 260.36]